jgi:hypothetical protein
MSDQLTLFAEDSLVSPSVPPGSGEARKMTATSGRRWLGLSPKRGPLGSLVRTLLASSGWVSTSQFLTWRPLATPAGRLLFRLAPSAPRIDATEFGLLPTATATLGSHGGQITASKARAGGTLVEHLSLMMLPTPTARDGRSIHASPETMARNSRPLSETIGALHQTGLLPTPTAADCARGVETPEAKKARGSNTGTTLNDALAVHGGRLNPRFVEWMMGYPIGHTELEP